MDHREVHSDLSGGILKGKCRITFCFEGVNDRSGYSIPELCWMILLRIVGQAREMIAGFPL